MGGVGRECTRGGTGDDGVQGGRPDLGTSRDGPSPSRQPETVPLPWSTAAAREHW